MQDVDEREPIEIVYPSDGSLKTLPTGTSICVTDPILKSAASVRMLN
jgi:hypothetical protein